MKCLTCRDSQASSEHSYLEDQESKIQEEYYLTIKSDCQVALSIEYSTGPLLLLGEQKRGWHTVNQLQNEF